MALGGGTFKVQNKDLPGSYINFVSAKKADVTLAQRGTVAMAIESNWGPAGEVIEIAADDFKEKSRVLFGYDYWHEKLTGIRDLFLNANKLYLYRLNTSGARASNTYATAKYEGTRGNDLKIIIQKNVDMQTNFDVMTYLDSVMVDKQMVKVASELKPNDFVDFKGTELSVTASTPLSGGTDGTVEVSAHQAFLNKMESYSFHALAYVGNNTQLANLYVQFTKRMREEIGAKFQTVLYNTKADYEGVVNVKNQCKENQTALVYWVAGAIAGCPINKSNLNKKYDGEFEVKAEYTQAELKEAIKNGEFTLHQVGKEIRVLEDVNSLITFTNEKGEDFKNNQVIRVLDQIAIDIAILFNAKYLGKIPNNQAGRISFWADVVKLHEKLKEIGAIEDFEDKDIEVLAGNDKKAISVSNHVKVTVAMAQLYMIVEVA